MRPSGPCHLTAACWWASRPFCGAAALSDASALLMLRPEDSHVPTVVQLRGYRELKEGAAMSGVAGRAEAAGGLCVCIAALSARAHTCCVGRVRMSDRLLVGAETPQQAPSATLLALLLTGPWLSVTPWPAPVDVCSALRLAACCSVDGFCWCLWCDYPASSYSMRLRLYRGSVQNNTMSYVPAPWPCSLALPLLVRVGVREAAAAPKTSCPRVQTAREQSSIHTRNRTSNLGKLSLLQ